MDRRVTNSGSCLAEFLLSDAPIHFPTSSMNVDIMVTTRSKTKQLLHPALPLLPELRCLIYEHLFTGREFVYARPRRDYALRPRRDCDLREAQKRWISAQDQRAENLKGVEILLASKLSRKEALKILHLHATFYL